MAKAKRRGRPPGSKNKKSIGQSVAKMDVSQLRAHIDGLHGVLAKKIKEQRAYFERQLSELGTHGSKPSSSATRVSRTGTRAKAIPKYQSRKDKSVKWSGRGMTPIWMREEMKGTKLKKEDFAIK